MEYSGKRHKLNWHGWDSSQPLELFTSGFLSRISTASRTFLVTSYLGRATSVALWKAVTLQILISSWHLLMWSPHAEPLILFLAWPWCSPFLALTVLFVSSSQNLQRIEYTAPCESHSAGSKPTWHEIQSSRGLPRLRLTACCCSLNFSWTLHLECRSHQMVLQACSYTRFEHVAKNLPVINYYWRRAVPETFRTREWCCLEVWGWEGATVHVLWKETNYYYYYDFPAGPQPIN